MIIEESKITTITLTADEAHLLFWYLQCAQEKLKGIESQNMPDEDGFRLIQRILDSK
jgi:hypothetical protein